MQIKIFVLYTISTIKQIQKGNHEKSKQWNISETEPLQIRISLSSRHREVAHAGGGWNKYLWIAFKIFEL